MIRVLARYTWPCLLGIALAVLSTGCQDANEAEFQAENTGGKGHSDPAAQNTPEVYRQRHSETAPKTAKAKPAPAPAAGSKASPDAKAEAAPAAEPEKKQP